MVKQGLYFAVWGMIMLVAVRHGLGDVVMDGLVYSSEENRPELIGEVVGWGMLTYAGSADFKNPDGNGEQSSATVSEGSIALPLPVYASEDWQAFAGPQVDWYRYAFDHVENLDDVDVYDVAVQLGVAYTGFQDWELMLSLAPGLYSDFREIGREDFKTFSCFMASWRCCPTVQWVGGAAYDTAFGDDEVYPVGGVRWDPSPKLSVQLLLPEPVILWSPVKRLLLFVHTLPAGGKWNTYDTTPEHDRYAFKTEGWRTGCGMEFQLTDSVWFHLAGGMEYDRKYTIDNDDGDTLMEEDVDDTWYMRAGLVLR